MEFKTLNVIEKPNGQCIAMYDIFLFNNWKKIAKNWIVIILKILTFGQKSQVSSKCKFSSKSS